jgi:hypothetical protein
MLESDQQAFVLEIVEVQLVDNGRFGDFFAIVRSGPVG